MLTRIMDAVGSWDYYFCGFVACLLAYELWRSLSPKWWSKTDEKLSRWHKQIKEKGTAHDLAISLALVFVCLVALGTQSFRARINIVTEHNVVILGRQPEGDWDYTSDEKPNGDTIRPCKEDKAAGVDTDGLLTQAVGYVAERATWEERGTCKSILRADLGFWFRDKNNNFQYRRIQ